MKGKQIVAIDIGSTNVVMAVGSVEDSGQIEILGVASEPVTGVNAGRIENSETVGRAVRAVKERLENSLGIKITEAYAGLSGEYIRCVPVTDHVYVQDEQGNGCNQITERDLESLDRRMQSVKLPDNKEEIISKEPLCFKVDDKEVREPVGAYGRVLAGTYNFILCDREMRERLMHCLLKQDISVKRFVPNALVSHLGITNTEDMEEGAIVINLGGGITDVTVLNNGKVCYIASIPIGMDIINDDIRAYGITGSYIESLKVQYGCAIAENAVDDKISFSQARKGTTKSIRRRNLARIIEERLKEICEWVKREIKEANCRRRFAPVVFLTGGGAELPFVEALFARELGYDEVRSVYPEYGFTENSLGEKVDNRAYATILSLLLYGSNIGCCSVAERPVVYTTPEPKPTPRTPNNPYGQGNEERETRIPRPTPRPIPTPTPTPIKPTPSNNGEEKEHNDEVKEEVPTRPLNPIVPTPKPTPTPKPETKEESKEEKKGDKKEDTKDEEFDIDTQPKSKGLKGWFTKAISSLGDTFAGKDEEY